MKLANFITENAELTEQDLIKALNSGEFRSAHSAAKRTPIFASLTGGNFQRLEPKFVKSPYIVMQAIEHMHPNESSIRRSAIGYTDHKLAAKQEGELYVLIPKVGSRVLVAGGESFIGTMTLLNKTLRIEKANNSNLLEALDILVGDIDTIESWKNLEGELKDSEASTPKTDNQRHIVASYKGRRGSPLDWFKSIIDPSANGVSVHLAESQLPRGREVALRGPCLAIRVKDYERLHKDGDIK